MYYSYELHWIVEIHFQLISQSTHERCERVWYSLEKCVFAYFI